MLNFAKNTPSQPQCNGMVILDIDGVVNSYSNRRFYVSFINKTIKNLVKIRGRKELIKALPEFRKTGGMNSLFVFIRNYCKDEKTFNQFNRDLISDIDFNKIPHDPSLKEFLGRLNNYGDLCVRSDSLGALAYGIWQRVINNKPSAEITKQLLADENIPVSFQAELNSKKINISGIEDNNMQIKTNIQSWRNFADKYKIDLKEAVLIDDSRSNVKVGKALGMTAVKVSKIDSLLHNTPFGGFNSLSDILGVKMSDSLKRCQIAYGPKVNVKTLFRTLLEKTPKITPDYILNRFLSSKNYEK